MSSSDDDTPLAQAKTNGSSSVTNLPSSKPGLNLESSAVTNGEDVEMKDAVANGASANKRKARQTNGKTQSHAEPQSSEDDKPLNKRARTTAKAVKDESSDSDAPLMSTAAKTKSKRNKTEDPDSDAPISKKLGSAKTSTEQKPARKKDQNASEKAQAPAKEPKSKKTATNGVKKSGSSDEDVPLSKKVPASRATSKATSKSSSRAKSEPDTPAKKGKAKAKSETGTPEAGEEEEEEYRWWENMDEHDGTIKWTTLEHNGVVFPPPHEVLPKDVKLLYNGKPVNLHPEAEEVAVFFGSMLNSTHNVENPTFQKNFFNDFTAVLKKTGGAKDNQGNPVAIKEFSKCDFGVIFEHFEKKKEEKKALSPAEKKAIKAEKDAAEAPYMYCIWDGRKQKVGNFRIEPPSLFRGRGEHPKTGKVKNRVMPEQITINIGKEAKVPAPPEGHTWKEIRHDQESTWLAMWQENVNGNYKYVMLAANSDVKGQSDYKKFEKARELKHYIHRIREDYWKSLKSELMVERQKATAVYLIDKFALRAGNEKGEDEAETAGCCSLKFEHVTLQPPNTIIFDFLGKDSIRFHEQFEVDPLVFKNLKIFKKEPKKEGDEIFDRLTTTALNKHLSNYMPGLTAKVFRTYNASQTMATLLRGMKSEGNVAEKVKDYNNANREVAILCNHRRTAAAGHAGQMVKMSDRIKGLLYQKWRLKQMMLDLDPKVKKQKGAAWFELDSDLDQDWIREHQAFLVEESRQKIKKKFEKDNEKRAAEGETELKTKDLEERLEAADELEAKFKTENKTKKVEVEGRGMTMERLETNISKLEQRIDNMSVLAEDKENNKEVALGTSRINYIDPRLTVVFSKKFNVPIEKFFSKTLREKFDWAIKSVDEDWEF